MNLETEKRLASTLIKGVQSELHESSESQKALESPGVALVLVGMAQTHQREPNIPILITEAFRLGAYVALSIRDAGKILT